MPLLSEALRAGLARHPAAPGARRRLLVAGGGGSLGAAVLERALGERAFERVTALCVRPMGVALQGLHTLVVDDFVRPVPLAADTALVVFDRVRGRHGREAAFLRPEPAALPALAAWLHAGGVTRLVLVLPHAPALLPAALKAGLASLDEQAVAALDFEQLAIVRPAGNAERAGGRHVLERLAHGMLSQLRWMVPQREQPVRPAKVAEFALRLAIELAGAAHGTRVAPPELVWLSAQLGAVPLVADWLAGRPLPQAQVRAGRL